MIETFRGWPCSDWTCSRCGKVHTAHWTAPGEYCPRCGRVVARIEWINGRVEQAGKGGGTFRFKC